MNQSMPSGAGHGHVFPNLDGVKSRCGGPGLCPDCSRDKLAFLAMPEQRQKNIELVADAINRRAARRQGYR